MLSKLFKPVLHFIALFTKGEVQKFVDKATSAVILAAMVAGVDINMIIAQVKQRVEEAKSSLEQHQELVRYLREQLLIAERNEELAKEVLAKSLELEAALPKDTSAYNLVPVTPVKLHVVLPAEAATDEVAA